MHTCRFVLRTSLLASFGTNVLYLQAAEFCAPSAKPIVCPQDPREATRQNKSHYFNELDPHNSYSLGSEHRKNFQQLLKDSQEKDAKDRSSGTLYSPEFLGVHGRLRDHFKLNNHFTPDDLVTLMKQIMPGELEASLAAKSPDPYMGALVAWIQKESAGSTLPPQEAVQQANIKFTAEVAKRVPELIIGKVLGRTIGAMASSAESKHKDAAKNGFPYSNSSDIFDVSLLKLYQSRFDVAANDRSIIDLKSSQSKHNQVSIKAPDNVVERSVTVARDGTRSIEMDQERPLVDGFKTAATESFFQKVPMFDMLDLKKPETLPGVGKSGTSTQKVEALLSLTSCEDYKIAKSKLGNSHAEFFTAFEGVAWRQIFLENGASGNTTNGLWCDAIPANSNFKKITQDTLRVLFSNYIASLIEVDSSGASKDLEAKLNTRQLSNQVDVAGLIQHWKITNPALAAAMLDSYKSGSPVVGLEKLLGEETTHTALMDLIPPEFYQEAFGDRGHGLSYEKNDDISECHQKQLVDCVNRAWMNKISHEGFDKLNVEQLSNVRKEIFDQCVQGTGLKSEALVSSAQRFSEALLDQLGTTTVATKNLHDVYNQNYESISDDPADLLKFQESADAMDVLKNFGMQISKKGHLGVDAAVEFPNFHLAKQKPSASGFPDPQVQEENDPEKLSEFMSFIGKKDKSPEETRAFVELIRASSVGNIMGDPPAPDKLQKLGEWASTGEASQKADWRMLGMSGLPDPVVLGRSVFIPHIHFDRVTRQNIKRVRVVDVADWEAEANEAVAYFNKTLKGKLEKVQEAGAEAASGSHQLKVIPGAIGYGTLRLIRKVSGGYLFSQSGSDEAGEVLIKYGTKEFEALSGSIQEFESAINDVGDKIPTAMQKLGLRGALGKQFTGGVDLSGLAHESSGQLADTVDAAYGAAKDKFISVGIQLATLPLLVEGGGLLCGGISRMVAMRGLTHAARQRIIQQGMAETGKFAFRHGLRAGRIGGVLNTGLGAGFGALREYANPFLNDEEREVSRDDMINTALAAIPALQKKQNPETKEWEYDYAEYSKTVMQTLVMTGVLTGIAGPLGEKTYFALKGERASKIALLRPLTKSELGINITSNLGVSAATRLAMYGGQQTEVGKYFMGETRSEQVKKAVEESAKTLDEKRTNMLNVLKSMKRAPGQSEEEFKQEVSAVRKEVATIEQSVAMMQNPTWKAAMADVAQDVIPDLLFAAAGARYYREGNVRVSMPEAKTSMNKMLLHQASVSTGSRIKPLDNGDVQVSLAPEAMSKMKNYAQRVHDFYKMEAPQYNKPAAGSFEYSRSGPSKKVEDGWANLSSQDKFQMFGRFASAKSRTFTIPAAEIPTWYKQTAKTNKPLADALLVEFARTSNPTVINPFLIQEIKAKTN